MHILDDRHRVKLHPLLGDSNSDYINANYIDVSPQFCFPPGTILKFLNFLICLPLSPFNISISCPLLSACSNLSFRWHHPDTALNSWLFCLSRALDGLPLYTSSVSLIAVLANLIWELSLSNMFFRLSVVLCMCLHVCMAFKNIFSWIIFILLVRTVLRINGGCWTIHLILQHYSC